MNDFLDIRRFFVMFVAVVLAVFAVIDLILEFTIASLILNILILVCCVIGAIGAYAGRRSFLGVFIICLTALFIYQIAVIIVLLVEGWNIAEVSWGIVKAVLLAIAIAATADLRRYTGVLYAANMPSGYGAAPAAGGGVTNVYAGGPGYAQPMQQQPQTTIVAGGAQPMQPTMGPSTVIV
jgi:hypothetical protein